MDENETQPEHFDMKDIIKEEKLSKKKRSKKNKKVVKGDTQDDFEVDTGDSRFAAILDSHHFAIDPTNPK
jgi:hypothetical protein